MKQIKLFNKALYVLVDDEDYEFLSKFTWYVKISNLTYYARTNIEKKTIYMHQLLLPSPSKDLITDHENRNGLDNQKHNLRLVTTTQNNLNRQKSRNNANSKYKGVYWEPRGFKWKAAITIKGKTKYLGTFKTEIAAAKAYNKIAIATFGEFATLNEFNEPLKVSEI